jgi:metallo-beta-lactamase class B
MSQLLTVFRALGFAILIATTAKAQPTPDELAKNTELFLQNARKSMKWDEPAEPARIVGPIYFVGTKGLGAFLLTGSEGHVLMYIGMPGSGPMIEASIRKLGFQPADIKIILTGHAHIDHVGGHAHLKKVSGGKIAMMREEKDLLESGGKLDFHYGTIKGIRIRARKGRHRVA